MSEEIRDTLLALHDLVMIKTITSQKKADCFKMVELKPYFEKYGLSTEEREKILNNNYTLGRVGKDE